MKKFSGYDDAKKAAENSGSERLPVGAYVCKVQGVRTESLSWGERIILAFDIIEGDYKDFFKKQYEANTSADKKWKGTARINIPKDDGTESDKWTKNAFAHWTNGFEKSNPGYVWDWDENKWKGKTIGIVFGETGTVIDGREVLFTEARSGEDIAKVRDGSYYHQKFKAKNGYTGTGAASSVSPKNNDFVTVPEGVEEEVPF